MHFFFKELKNDSLIFRNKLLHNIYYNVLILKYCIYSLFEYDEILMDTKPFTGITTIVLFSF